MNLPFSIGVNGFTLGRSFVLRRFQRYVNEIIEGLGPQRIGWMIQNKKGLGAFLKPEVEAQYRAVAGNWGWAANVITDDDFVKALPEWAHVIVERHGQDGIVWLQEQIVWIRGFFTGRKHGGQDQRPTDQRGDSDRQPGDQPKPATASAGANPNGTENGQGYPAGEPEKAQ